MTRSQDMTQHYTPHATLAAIGIKIHSLKLFDTIKKHVFIKQKTIRHTPIEKLNDAFIAILAGAHGLCEINTRLRSDESLQRAFGRSSCAEQSVVQQTLNACTARNVAEMQQAVGLIFRRHGRAFHHNYRKQWQLLDIDMTGMPCSKRAELSAKGYFSTKGIRYGRQLGRIVATHYQEIVTDRLYPGNVQLSKSLRQLVALAEETLDLNEFRRSRTILRIDAGGGSLDEVNWMLSRGYQLHGKDISARRAEGWAYTVKQWYDDPQHPGRQVGWAEPEATPDYVLPVKRLVIRWHKRNGQTSYGMLISTLAPRDVLGLLGQPTSDARHPEKLCRAYAQLYDKRGGAVEIEIKEDKQGFGMVKRQKRKAEAQEMLVLLNQLAHNVLMWARNWLTESAPKLARLGILRLVRDLLSVSGMIELNQRNSSIRRVVINRAAPLTSGFFNALRALLLPQHVVIILDKI
jgi:Transposase DDE domain group 1